MKELTSEQRELAESNLGIAYAVAAKYSSQARLKESLHDSDLLSVSMMGLCRAARGYKPELDGSFAVYAFVTCRDWVICEISDNGFIGTPKWLRNKSRKNHKLRPLRDAARGHLLSITDVDAKNFPGTQFGYDPIEMMELREAIADLPRDKRLLLQSEMAGYNHAESARGLGLPRGSAQHMRNVAVAQLREKFGDDRKTA